MENKHLCNIIEALTLNYYYDSLIEADRTILHFI